MQKPPPTENPCLNIPVLSAGSSDDHVALADIFLRMPWPLCPGTRWELKTSLGLSSALFALRTHKIPIVLCDCDLGPVTWIEMLEQLRLLPSPPFLIVTSRLADDRLWAEALNLGAYDVLAKPFEAKEVVRSLSLAWLQWTNQWKVPTRPRYRVRAAG